MRKSPIKHHVHQHQRETSDGKTTVHDYERGHGNAQISNPNIKHSSVSSSFTVYINYLDESATETLSVKAINYPSAIQQAMASRRNVSTPTVVEAFMK
jgi:hypothetical protein